MTYEEYQDIVFHTGLGKLPQDDNNNYYFRNLVFKWDNKFYIDVIDINSDYKNDIDYLYCKTKIIDKKYCSIILMAINNLFIKLTYKQGIKRNNINNEDLDKIINYLDEKIDARSLILEIINNQVKGDYNIFIAHGKCILSAKDESFDFCYYCDEEYAEYNFISNDKKAISISHVINTKEEYINIEEGNRSYSLIIENNQTKVVSSKIILGIIKKENTYHNNYAIGKYCDNLNELIQENILYLRENIINEDPKLINKIRKNIK